MSRDDQTEEQLRAEIERSAERVAELESELQQLSHAVQQSPVGVLVTDAEARIEYVNPEFTRMTGYSAAEVLGRNPHVLKSGQQPSAFYEDLWRTIRDGRIWRGDFANRKKNGEVYWERCSISPIRSPEGHITHFVAVKEDVTGAKQAAAELAATNQRIHDNLEHARELTHMRDSLTHMIVHDLRTPLTGVLWNLKMLTSERGKSLPAEQVSRCLERAEHATVDLVDMVNSLLDVHRLEEGRMPLDKDEHDIEALVCHGVEMLVGDTDGKHIDIQPLPTEIRVTCDRDVIQRVITNLVGNAVKFVPEGGHVVVAMTPSLDGLRVDVADDGPGIRRDDQARIFDQFGQVRIRGATGAKRSTGLGLTFCKLAVEAHGGSIGVQSEPGEGCTFWFTLPHVPATPESQTPPSAGTCQTAGPT